MAHVASHHPVHLEESQRIVRAVLIVVVMALAVVTIAAFSSGLDLMEPLNIWSDPNLGA